MDAILQLCHSQAPDSIKLTSKHLTGDGISRDFSSLVSTINNPKSFSVGHVKV